MYKFERYRQLGLADFNQPVGLKMNPENRWVKKAETIPWDAIEEKYAKLFPSKTGMPAKPLRMALGSPLIQKQLGFSDRELVEEITENPYFQYFIRLPGYQTESPFVPSLLVEFRKCLTDDILGKINEMIIVYNTPDDSPPGGEGNPDTPEIDTAENNGTLILDATCAPQNISFPQDVNLLNEARENLEGIVDDLHRRFDYYVPRMYHTYCREHRIRLSGSSLGRPKKDAGTDKKTEYKDNAARIAVERTFALAKQKYGLGLFTSRLDETTRCSIALSIIAMNVDRICRTLLRLFYNIFISRYK